MARHSAFFIAAVVMALLVGCGGGGGGGNGGGGTVNLAPGQYMEFIANGQWIDPFNLTVGATGTAVIANYDSFGNRTVLASSNWTTTAGGGFVSINANTGQFTVLAAPAGEFKFQGTATILGSPTLFEQRGRVPQALAVINGRVTELSIFTGLPSSVGIPHLDVDFFNGAGTLVGSARTMQNGTFSAIVPAGVEFTMVHESSIRISKYYKSVYYQGGNYNPLDSDCRVPIGPTGGGVTNLPSWMGLPQVSGGPPPPPSGC